MDEKIIQIVPVTGKCHVFVDYDTCPEYDKKYSVFYRTEPCEFIGLTDEGDIFGILLDADGGYHTPAFFKDRAYLGICDYKNVNEFVKSRKADIEEIAKKLKED